MSAPRAACSGCGLCGGGLLETDTKVRRRSRTSTAHELGEDVTQIDPCESPAEGRAASPASKHLLHAPALVVLAASFGGADSLVGGLYRLEALLGRRIVGIPVGVVLSSNLAVRALDLGIGSVLGDPEHAVRVLGHRICLTGPRLQPDERKMCPMR